LLASCPTGFFKGCVTTQRTFVFHYINNPSEKGLGAHDIAMLSARLFAEVQWQRMAMTKPEARNAAFRDGWFFTGDLSISKAFCLFPGARKIWLRCAQARR
jgi:hypothetical protein